MHYIGKIDKKKIGEYSKTILTDDVILTEERRKHMIEHHPELGYNDINYIKKVLKNPDFIFQDRKNCDTLLIIKNVIENDKIYRMVIKLNTNSSIQDKSNSIISFWSINEKKLNQYIRNERIIFKKLDKNE